MLYRSSPRAAALAAALMVTMSGVRAADHGKYPDWKGAWTRFVAPAVGGQPSHDQTKPWGFGQQAPLIAEYEKVLRDSMADQVESRCGAVAVG